MKTLKFLFLSLFVIASLGSMAQSNEIRMKNGTETINGNIIYYFFDSGGKEIADHNSSEYWDLEYWNRWYQSNESCFCLRYVFFALWKFNINKPEARDDAQEDCVWDINERYRESCVRNYARKNKYPADIADEIENVCNYYVYERDLLGLSANTAQIFDEQHYENDYADSICLCVKESIIQVHTAIVSR